MKQKDCLIAPYIKNKNFPSDEENRLNTIHLDIFTALIKSDLFRKVNEKLVSKKDNFRAAQLLIAELDAQHGKKGVVTYTKVRVGRRREADLTPSVDVLILARDTTPATKEQLQNREDLADNEPYVAPIRKGNPPKDGTQFKLFNLQSYRRNTQDYEVESKYFAGGLSTSSGEVLSKIAKSNHPLNKVAEKILAYDPGVPLSLVKDSKVEKTEKGAAAYYPDARAIKVAKYAYFRGLGVEPTLIHEIMHAATRDYLRNHSSSKEVQAMNRLYQIALENKDKLKGDKYGLSDLDEFVVAIFTDAEMVDFLTKIPSTKDIRVSKSLFEDAIDAILSMFGITKENKTLYEQAAAVVSMIVVDNYNMNKEEERFTGLRQHVKVDKDRIIEDQNITEQEYLDLQEAIFGESKKDQFRVKLQDYKQGKLFSLGAEPTIKPGVAELFESNPELANIGTAEQYSQYLDTVFPDSKVKDIVYHGAMENMLPKDGKFKGYVTYFTDFKKYAETFGFPINRKVISAVINTKAPFNSQSELADVPEEVHNTDKFTNPRLIKSNTKGYDSVIGVDAGQKEGKTIAIFEPEQIHILGSKQDIEGFKKHTNKKSRLFNTDAVTQKVIDLAANVSPMYRPEVIANPLEALKAIADQAQQDEFTINNTIKIFGKELVELAVETFPKEGMENIPNIYQTIANNKTVAKIRELLDKLGIPVHVSETILKEFGANGFADAVKGMITVANGKEDVALTEEAMHMITMMIPEELLAPLLEKITDYKIYKETFAQYKTHAAYQNADGTPNIDKIKLEAVGKLLAEYYIMDSEGLSENEVNVAKTLWADIKDWLRTIFLGKVEIFQDFVNKINNGELQITNSASRKERLYNLNFHQSHSEALGDMIGQNRNVSALNDPALSTDPNIIALNKITDLVSRIRKEDIPTLLSLKEYVHLPIKKTFNESADMLAEALVTDNLSKRMTNAVEYIRTSYYNITALQKRSEDISTMLRTGVNIKGEPLDAAQKMFLFNEISRIDDMAQIYEDHIAEFGLLLKDEPNTLGLDKVVESIIGKTASIKRNNNATNIKSLHDLFEKTLAPKVAGYRKLKQQDIDKMTSDMNNTTVPWKKAAMRVKIDKMQEEYDNPPISAANVMNLIQDKSDQSRFTTSVSLYMEGGMTHKDEAIQAIANLLSEASLDANKRAAEDFSKYLDLFVRHGLKQNIKGDAYDEYTEIVTMYSFNESKGELEEYKDYRLLSEVAQWRFENDLEILDYLIHSAETGANQQAAEEEYLKFFGVALTDDEKLDLKTTFEQKRKELVESVGSKKYSDKYYEIQAILDNAVLSRNYVDPVTRAVRPMTVRDYRQPYFERMNAARQASDNATDPLSKEMALLEIEEAEKALKELSSEYDYETGDLKQGDELIVAQTLAAFSKAKRKVEYGKDPVTGEALVADIDEYYVTEAAREKWTAEKAAIEQEFTLAEQAYTARPSPANKVALDKAEEELADWRRTNVREVIPQEFYDEVEAIYGAIAEIHSYYAAEGEKDAKDIIEETRATIKNMTKGLKDIDGIIDGTKGIAMSSEINYLQRTIEEMKLAIKEARPKMSDADYMEILILFEDLESIQKTPLTKYWYEIEEAHIARLRQDHFAATGEIADLADLMESFSQTQFFKENTLDVTKNFRYHKKNEKLPPNVIKIGKKYYKPIYIWNETMPIGKFSKVDEMSNKWRNYRVNKAFVNPNYETIQGKVRLDASKVVSNPLAPSRYESPRYNALSAEKKAFLTDLKEMYYKDQMNKRKSERLGDSLPRISSRGIHRLRDRATLFAPSKKQVMRLLQPWHWSFKGAFNKERLMELIGNDVTLQEEEYGSGKNARREGKLRFTAKYINKGIPIQTREKDMFRTISMYNMEYHRATAMQELLPAMNTILSNMKQSTSRFKSAKFEIEKRVNKRTRSSTNAYIMMLDKIQSVSHSGLAMTRLFMPHFISSSIKNTANGAYQMWINSSKLVQYSKGSFTKAYANAFKMATIVTVEQFATVPSKYMAIVKRLNVVANLDIHDSSINNAETLLKIANSLGYWSGAVRRISEVQQELTMFELVKQTEKFNGQDLLDAYDYNPVTGEVKPKVNVITNADGTTTEVPVISTEKENEITNKVKNMQQFTQGNFSADNSIYAKMFFLGRMFLFMKGFVYNPSMVRFGKKRFLSTGQEIEGYYRIFFSILFSSPRQIVNSSTLTANEKDAVLKMCKEVVILNAFGAAMLAFAKYMKESGDDDEESPFLWNVLLAARRIYAEASFFNLIDGVGKYIIMGDEDNRVRGNAIENVVWFAARPGVEALGASFVPVDFKGLRFDNDDIKTKDPYYSQFKDNWLLFDFLKTVKAKPDMLYPQSTLSSFEYYDKSIWAYTKDNKGKAKRTRSKKRKY